MWRVVLKRFCCSDECSGELGLRRNLRWGEDRLPSTVTAPGSMWMASRARRRLATREGNSWSDGVVSATEPSRLPRGLRQRVGTAGLAAQDYVESGGIASDIYVLAAGIEQVLFGGRRATKAFSAVPAFESRVTDRAMLFGAQQYVYGSGIGTTVSSGGVYKSSLVEWQTALSFWAAASSSPPARPPEPRCGRWLPCALGGVASNTASRAPRGRTSFAGGLAVGNTIGRACQLDYGTANSTTLGVNAVQLVFGSAASTIAASGALQDVMPGASARTTVSGGGYQFLWRHGKQRPVGRAQFVFNAGASNVATVSSGAVQHLPAGGSSSATSPVGRTTSGGAPTRRSSRAVGYVSSAAARAAPCC